MKERMRRDKRKGKTYKNKNLDFEKKEKKIEIT